MVFLDEPTTGLDPRTRNDLWALVRELVEEGTTVLLTTQYMEEAEHLAHRIAVIDGGRLVAEGTAEELKHRIGGDVLDAQVAHPVDLERAGAVIAPLGEGPLVVDADLHRVSVPAQGGTPVLIRAGELLEQDGIALADLGLRRPSLDDVFPPSPAPRPTNATVAPSSPTSVLTVKERPNDGGEPAWHLGPVGGSVPLAGGPGHRRHYPAQSPAHPAYSPVPTHRRGAAVDPPRGLKVADGVTGEPPPVVQSPELVHDLPNCADALPSVKETLSAPYALVAQGRAAGRQAGAADSQLRS